MNEASRWRLELARKLVLAYRDNPNVRAVLVGGSVARGCADRYSDIELGVFWDEPPTDEFCLSITRVLGGTPGGFVPHAFDGAPPSSGARLERLYLGGDKETGLLIEVQHETVGRVEGCIADVIARHDTSLSKQELIAVIGYGVPLCGVALIEEWRERTSPYPVQLSHKVIAENLRVGPWSRKELYAERNEVLLTHEDLARTGLRLLTVLMGLNRLYAPSDDFKWMELIIKEMSIAPPELARRLKRVFGRPPGVAVADLKTLWTETVALLEEHMPEVDTSEARRQLESPRTVWDRAPTAS